MKWKDSGDMEEKDTSAEEEEYFDEEQYSPWADQENHNKRGPLNKTKALFGLLVGAIIALVVTLLVLVMGGGTNGGVSPQQMAQVEERLQKLEERLDKFEAIDEKVTRIWEQAKAFETFKDRFERSEASMSLRMDHLTMSLEAMQKQLTEAQAPVAVPSVPAKSSTPKATVKTTAKTQYHQVKPGETLYSISKQYNLKVDRLLQMNQMKPGSVIQPGQKLIVRQP